VIDMRKFAVLGAIAALSVGAQSAAAAGFSYNLLEGSFVSGDNFDGIGVAGALELTPEFFGHAGFDALEADNGLDLSLLSIGGGYNRAINENLDIVATASLKRIKVDGAGSDMGFGLGVGVRGRVLSQLELHGGLEYVDFDNSDTTLQVGGRWYFTPVFAAGLDLQDNDGGSTLRFTARYDFGSRM
jgi:hypothetical protein